MIVRAGHRTCERGRQRRLAVLRGEWLKGLAKRDMIEKSLAGLLSDSTEANIVPKSKTAFAVPKVAPPTCRSYWVVERTFLAGAYSGAPDRPEHREWSEKIWNAGIRAVIKLVEEHETNNTGQSFHRYDDIVRERAREAVNE